MSGSLPHSIAVANHTMTPPITPGHTQFDTRSDDDTSPADLNASNAKASSDLIVTISEEAKALAQRYDQLREEDRRIKEQNEQTAAELAQELEDEFADDDY